MTVTPDEDLSTLTLRPRYAASNIRTWIGFRQFMHLVEEAVVQWFRDHGAGPQALYHHHGLGLAITGSSAQLPAVLEVDEVVSAEVSATAPGRFSVRLSVARDGDRTVICKSKVIAVLVREAYAPGALPVSDHLADLVVERISSSARDLAIPNGQDIEEALRPAGITAFAWSWCARYFHCHYSDRVQHSAYVQALEETVERFLASRGISVGTMLTERGWIPVVSRVAVRMLSDVHMEELVYTRFTVEDVLKRTAYDSRMDCYVRRGDNLVHTATARILHGYAITRGDQAGRLAEFDDRVLVALTEGDPG